MFLMICLLNCFSSNSASETIKMITTTFYNRLKDGKELVPSGKYVIEKTDDTYTLVLTSVTDEDAGQYTVTATNDFGKSSFTATLITHGWRFQNRYLYLFLIYLLYFFMLIAC